MCSDNLYYIINLDINVDYYIFIQKWNLLNLRLPVIDE